MRPLLLALIISAPALGEDKPTRAALRSAFESNLRSVVDVVGPRGRGLGVIVGAEGQVLTSVQYVSLRSAKVRREGQTLDAKVLMANAQLQVALLLLQGNDFPAAPARPFGPLLKGSWLVAIERTKPGPLEARIGQITKSSSDRSPFVETNLSLKPGSPVFDAKGRLVGVCAGKNGRVLPLAAVKAQLAAEAQR
ncbi:MAG: S1 family peptidase [Myxococcaceae bacterium]